MLNALYFHSNLFYGRPLMLYILLLQFIWMAYHIENENENENEEEHKRNRLPSHMYTYRHMHVPYSILMTANWRQNDVYVCCFDSKRTKLLSVNSGYPCVKANTNHCCVHFLNACFTILDSLSLLLNFHVDFTFGDRKWLHHLKFDKNKNTRNLDGRRDRDRRYSVWDEKKVHIQTCWCTSTSPTHALFNDVRIVHTLSFIQNIRNEHKTQPYIDIYFVHCQRWEENVR